MYFKDSKMRFFANPSWKIHVFFCFRMLLCQTLIINHDHNFAITVCMYLVLEDVQVNDINLLNNTHTGIV